MNKPTSCIDPIIKYCQGYQYDWIKYLDWVETFEDLDGYSFKSGCIYGLESIESTEEELKEFDKWMKKNYREII